MLDKKDTKYIIRRIITYFVIAMIMSFISSFKVHASVITDYYNSYSTDNFYICENTTCGINTTSNNPFKNTTGKLTFTIYQAPEKSGVEMINEIIVSDNGGNLSTCNLGNVLFYNDNNTQRVVTTAVCDVSFGSNGWRNITIHRRGGGKLFLLFSEYATLTNNGENADVSSQLQSIYNRLSSGFTDLYNMQYPQYVSLNNHLIDIYHKMLENNTSVTQSINNNTQAVNDVNNSINDSNVDTNSANNTFNDLNNNMPTNSVISDLILMPITFINKVLDGANNSCSTYHVGELWGDSFDLPCINGSDYVGATLWNVIDCIGAGMLAFMIGKRMVRIFNDLTNLKDGGLDSAYD